jgi:phosphoglycolate phosphatase
MAVNKYKHVVWDWNGTLLNDAWLCVEVMNTMLAERSLPAITEEIYKNIFNFPVREYYLLLGFDFDKEPFEEVGMEFMVLYNQRQHECKLHLEVKSVLERVAEMGYSQSILSAREQNELRLETNNLAVNHFFTLIYGLDDHYAHGKTDVGFTLLADLKCPKAEVLFVGDTLHDAEVAAELGIDCVLVPNGHHSKERLLRQEHPIVNSLTDILNILSK